ncbi:hypothetical protein EV122DRAFT_219044, partial [Schizophyllum commune]
LDRRLSVGGVGSPQDPEWEGEVIGGVHDIMAALGPKVAIPSKSTNDRRGSLGAVNIGLSFGGGQQRPGNLYVTKANQLLLREAMASQPFLRLTGHVDTFWQSLWGDMHHLYAETLEAVLEADPKLRRNFPKSVMACATFNFGPRTVSLPHRDSKNLAFGLCIVHAQGDYDADKGGHIVLEDLNYIIRFPPGATIIFPSALIRHYNTDIRPGEVRQSFTQFTSGHLFRWAYNGGRTDKDAQASFDGVGWSVYDLHKAERRAEGPKFFPEVV